MGAKFGKWFRARLAYCLNGNYSFRRKPISEVTQLWGGKYLGHVHLVELLALNGQRQRERRGATRVGEQARRGNGGVADVRVAGKGALFPHLEDADPVVTHLLVLPVAESLDRGNRYRVAGVDPHRVEVLD